MSKSPGILKGTLDLLILKAISRRSLHGYGVGRWIRDLAGEDIELEDGALYHALHRLERRGSIEGEWGPSETGRRAKFYRLTEQGRRQLVEQESRWEAYSRAVARILGAPQEDPG